MSNSYSKLVGAAYESPGDLAFMIGAVHLGAALGTLIEFSHYWTPQTLGTYWAATGIAAVVIGFLAKRGVFDDE